MKKTLKIIGAIIALMLVIGAIVVFSVLHLITSLIKGDEVFETTTEEVESFQQVHLSGDAALDQYFIELADKTGSDFVITDRQINRDESFNESTYIKDEGGLDTQRQVYVDVAYQTDIADSSPYTACETCRYEATATYEYENEEYTLDTVKFKHDWLETALANTLVTNYVEPGTLPDSPYYYRITSERADNKLIIDFNELSDTGYWDKDSSSFMLTTPWYSDLAQTHNGIIAGELFNYATDETTTGFLQISDDGTLSLYTLPASNPYSIVETDDITNAELVKTFNPK